MCAENPNDSDSLHIDINGSNFVGRDHIIHGDVIHGDKVMGDKISIGQIINFVFGSDTERHNQRNRQTMLKQVGDFWVKGVLEQSLHREVLIQLGMEEYQEAVNRPWDTVLQIPNRPNRVLPSVTKIIDIFDEMGQALLILGEPGSGKTTVLLELARDLLARADRDLTQPIPAVFNLSSWTNTTQPISEWLVEELCTKYNIRREVARTWIKDDDLLLLLDGLDEVVVEEREICVQAINTFRQEHKMPLVVCSRVADYDALTTRLQLGGAIVLKPLNHEQIDAYLDQVGEPLTSLRMALQNDPTLLDLAQTPLILSVMSLAYWDKTVEEIQMLVTLETRHKHLFDTYVQQMFQRRDPCKPYTSGQAIKWLSWLAQKMEGYSQTVFLIEQIQPSWLPTQPQQRTYKVLGILIWGLLYGLIGGLLTMLPPTMFWTFMIMPTLDSASFEGTPGEAISWLLLFGSVGVAIGGLIGGLKIVKDKEIKKIINWSEARDGLLWGVTIGMFSGLTMIIGIATLSSTLEITKYVMLTLAFGLLMGLFGGLSGGLINCGQVVKASDRTRGLWAKVRVGILYGFMIGLLFGTLYGLKFGLLPGVIIGLMDGLIYGLLGGLMYGWQDNKIVLMLLFGVIVGLVVEEIYLMVFSILSDNAFLMIGEIITPEAIKPMILDIITSILIRDLLFLPLGLFGALLAVLATPKEAKEIKTVEQLKWSWASAKLGLRSGLKGGLIIGLAIGMLLGVTIGWVIFLGSPQQTSTNDERLRSSAEDIQENRDFLIEETGLSPLLLALSCMSCLTFLGGLVFMPIIGLLNGFGAGLRRGEIDTKISPNQGIRQSAKNALLTFLISGLLVTPFCGLLNGLIGVLLVGLPLGLLIGLFNGGIAVIQHYILRLILAYNNYLPWNMVRFFDYAAERIFLRKVGGGYIFTHRLLLEYFASLKLS